MNVDTLGGGFATPAHQSARAFRAALDALSRPGLIRQVDGAAPPAPLSIAAGVLLLTLVDGTTPVHLAGDANAPAVRDWITFHTGAPLVDAARAVFAVGTWDALLPVSRFAVGLPDYPDRAATLIIEVPTLDGTGPRLTGPGIRTKSRLPLPDRAAFRANRALFPLGFDCFLTSGARLAALPRSTDVGDD
jgi:alpha-D-ribose 1-methylphosphonate 5-triphosphate synthase subunit PhnH